jgi:Fic family protein
MQTAAPSSPLEALYQTVTQYPEGIGIEQLLTTLTPSPARRSLQRWLATLVRQGRLRKVDRGRATRYVAEPITGFGHIVIPTPIIQGHVTVGLPLTDEAQSVLNHVSLPLQRRTPVGYDQDFLERYQPNTTYYLPEQIRKDLLVCGQPVGADLPAGTHARRIANRLLIDLSWNSSRLEGNTYSLLETERLLSDGEMASGKDTLETQMILNHKAAIEFLITSAADIGFTRYTIQNLHALLSDNLLPDPAASGRLRTQAVGIGLSVFHPLENPQRIEECFDRVLVTAAAIIDPFEQAFFAMAHLPYLQPFDDVNKRVSRLSANIPFITHNLCPLSFVDVPHQLYLSAMLGIYETQRIELLRDIFAWAYRRSCAKYASVRQSMGEPDAFRLRYRTEITEFIKQVVRLKMDKASAIAFIHSHAKTAIPLPDQPRFIEIVETELMHLRESNIARHSLRPSEYATWRNGWK